MNEPPAYVFPPYRLIPAERRLLSHGVPVKLGGRAFDVLVSLVERRDRTVSTRELMDLVWPRLVVEENNLQVQVVALRKLLGHAAVATVPGRGYRFTLPVVVDGMESKRRTEQSEEHVRVTAPSNLPSWMPPLYGRDDDLRSLAELMDRHAWVTVVGSAGIGKTRLAQAAARGRLAGGQAVVWWVDLASVVEPALITNAVSTALGLTMPVNDAMTRIVAALSAPGSLLVLDNVEHLLDGVAQLLGKLRPALAGLRLLLTSQENLHAADEYVFRLEPLSLATDATVEAAQRSGAVQLFLARAQASDRRFALDETTCPRVVDICRRLDGIPLAIELAAARLPLLGLEGLLSRLDYRFEVLTSGDRTALRRHRTLQEAVDWSYRLLSLPEQAVFRRIGVFAGGFTLDAAQAVAADDEVDEWDVLEHLGALVDKSLVVAVGDPIPRYHLLETLRLFAVEQLLRGDEVERARAAHRDHYMFVAEAASRHVNDAGAAGLPVLDIERDNIISAMSWHRCDADGSLTLRLAAAMHQYWTSRGLLERGLESLRAALAHPGVKEASMPLFRVEMSAAAFCAMTGRDSEGLGHVTRARDIASQLHDEPGLARALARSCLFYVRLDEIENAARCGQEALALARSLRDPGAIAFALDSMSSVDWRTGRRDQALAKEAEILEIRRGLNDVRGVLVASANIAWTNTELGKLAVARRHIAEALDLLPRVDSEFYGASLIRVAAVWAAGACRYREAVRLHSAYRNQAARIGLLMPEQTEERECLTRAREALEPSEHEKDQSIGMGWTYEEGLEHVAALLRIANEDAHPA